MYCNAYMNLNYFPGELIAENTFIWMDFIVYYILFLQDKLAN